MVAWVSVTRQPHFSPVMMPPVQTLSPLCAQRRQWSWAGREGLDILPPV